METWGAVLLLVTGEQTGQTAGNDGFYRVCPRVFLSISSPVRGMVAPPTPLLTPADQLSLLLPLNKAVPQSAEFAGPRGNTGQSASFLTGSHLPRPPGLVVQNMSASRKIY